MFPLSIMLLLWSAALFGSASVDTNAGTDVSPISTSRSWGSSRPPIVGAHYFGSHWAPNFINAFRRSEVAADFQRIREDGFNTVILVVSWGDFQPITNPCCQYDDRAIERLHFLLQRAKDAGLAVILRLGYFWSYHPGVPDIEERALRLMNSDRARGAFFHYVQRIAHEISAHDHVIMSFLSWEDHTLERIDQEGAHTFRRWHRYFWSPSEPPPNPDAVTREGSQALLYYHYWDWLAIEKLFRPAEQLMPNLSYEARVDKDPILVAASEGAPRVAQWFTHEPMFRMPTSAPLTIYYAPFWGAVNDGETLSADRALTLFDRLLTETRALSDGAPVFIDQFNFLDNTPGAESNAIIQDDEIGAFLNRSNCLMRTRGVIGYGVWTSRDYRESRLFNPSFAYQLDGWDLVQRSRRQSFAPLVPLADGDFALNLAAGDALSQMITDARGRVPGPDDRDDFICLHAESPNSASRVSVSAGDPSKSYSLAFPRGFSGERCAKIAPQPDDGEVRLRIAVDAGTILLYDVWFFDHVQVGGIYQVDGSPSAHRQALVDLNQGFAQDAPFEACPED